MSIGEGTDGAEEPNTDLTTPSESHVGVFDVVVDNTGASAVDDCLESCPDASEGDRDGSDAVDGEVDGDVDKEDSDESFFTKTSWYDLVASTGDMYNIESQCS